MLVFSDYIFMFEMEESKMFNMHNNKNKRIVSVIIIIVLVLAMVVPMLASAFM